MSAHLSSSQATPVEKHIETWVTVYEREGWVTIQKCAFRSCPNVAVRQWEGVQFVTTIWPNGDMELRLP